MRAIIRYLGITASILLLLVLGVATSGLAYVSGYPTITPSTQWTVVSNVQASYSFSSAQSSVTVSNIPGNVFLGPYSNGYYNAAFNITVTLRNGGYTTGTANLAVSCPSPLGSQSQTVTTAVGTTTVTFTYRLSQPTQIYPGGTITCSITESLVRGSSGANITSVTLQMPIPIASWGADTYSGQVYPAFTVSFIAPSIGGNNPSVSIVPFGGLSIKSTLFVPALGTSYSDTASISLGTQTAGASLSYEFIVISEPWYGYTTNTAPILVTTTNVNAKYWQTAFTFSSPYLTYIGAGTTATYPQVWWVLGTPILIFNETKGLYLVTNAQYVTGSVSLVGASTTVSVPYYALSVTNGSTYTMYAFEIKPDVSGSNLPIPYLMQFTVYQYKSAPPMSTKTQVWSGITKLLTSVPGLTLGLSTSQAKDDLYVVTVSVGTPLITQSMPVYVRINELFTQYVTGAGTSTAYVPSQVGKVVNSTATGFAGLFSSNNVVYTVNVISTLPTSTMSSYLVPTSTVNVVPLPPLIYFNTTSSSFVAMLNMTLYNRTASNTEYYIIVAPYTYGIATLSSSGYTYVTGGRTGVSISITTATQHQLSLTYSQSTGLSNFGVYAYPWGSVYSTVYNYVNGVLNQTGYTTTPIYTSGRLFKVYESGGSLVSVMNYMASMITEYNGTPANVLIMLSNYNATLTPRFVVQTQGGIATFSYYPSNAYASVQYNSVNGPVSFTIQLQGEDPTITVPLPLQPAAQSVPLTTAPSVVGVSVSPQYVTAAPGQMIALKVLVTLSSAPSSTVTMTGSIRLATYTGTFSVTAPAGSTTATATISIPAPTTPGLYVGYVTVGNETASFSVAVTSFVITPGTIVLIAVIVIAIIIVFILWRRRKGGGGVVEIEI